jgi:hypothetical protein
MGLLNDIGRAFRGAGRELIRRATRPAKPRRSPWRGDGFDEERKARAEAKRARKRAAKADHVLRVQEGVAAALERRIEAGQRTRWNDRMTYDGNGGEREMVRRLGKELGMNWGRGR